MCLVRVLAVLKATEIVARRCIFAERGALEDGHPIVARRSGAARRVDTSMSILGRRIQQGFSARARTRDAAVPGLGAVLGLWVMPRLRPDYGPPRKNHRSKATNLVRVGAARG